MKTIFILEDDESFAIIFKRWLTEEGYNAITATNIKEAKEKLKEIDVPDLFWVDYYLREDEKNGMDFFKWLKETSQFSKIPVIVVSITVDAEKLADFEKQGVAKTFSKTIMDRETILEGIKKIIG